MGFFYEFPHTRTYDKDLGWLINAVKELRRNLENFVNLNTIKYADPINWDITKQYETNTIVVDSYDGTAYISVKPIPVGVSISNTDYWTPIFNYGDAIENIKSNVASNEQHSETATMAYTKDSLVWYNDDLYLTLADLPIGTAFIMNENIRLCTVENFIRLMIDDLKSYVDEQDADLKTYVDEKDIEVRAYVDSSIENIVGVLFAFDTVADMAASDRIKNSDIVKTLGYYDKNDGGGAYYKITDSVPNSYYETCGDLYAELIVGDVVNVLQFGAIPNDSTKASINNTAIQNAFNACKRYGTIYFPKNGTSENSVANIYYVSTSLILDTTYSTITSEPSTDYTTAIYAENLNDYILKVTRPGVRIENIQFMTALEPLESFSDVDGILLDRSSVTTAAIGANLDVTISNCLFVKLRNCLTAKGRNVNVTQCTFSNSKNGITILPFIDSDSNYTITRGIILSNNRFHSMGGAYRDNLNSVYDDLSHLDSWCIITPMEGNQLSGIEVSDNYADLCIAGFYTGCLTYTNIKNNTIYAGGGVFIRSLPTDETYKTYAASHFGVISGNMIEPAPYPTYNFTFRCIDISYHRGIVVCNNSIEFSHGAAISFAYGAREYINGNTINEGAREYQEDGIIHIQNTAYVYISGNSINGAGRSVYAINTNSAYIWLNGNSVGGCTDIINSWSNVQNLILDRFIREETTGTITTALSDATFVDNYCFRKGDVVNVGAQISLSTPVTTNGVFFNVPDRFRPSHETVCYVFMNISGVVTPFIGKIATNGDVRITFSNSQSTNLVGFYAAYALNL